jgi:hypothetical protein
MDRNNTKYVSNAISLVCKFIFLWITTTIEHNLEVIGQWQSVIFSKLLVKSQGGSEKVCQFGIYMSHLLFHDEQSHSQSHNIAHAYNKGYTVKIMRIVIVFCVKLRHASS